jgi:hypothetical protein
MQFYNNCPIYENKEKKSMDKLEKRLFKVIKFDPSFLYHFELTVLDKVNQNLIGVTFILTTNFTFAYIARSFVHY